VELLAKVGVAPMPIYPVIQVFNESADGTLVSSGMAASLPHFILCKGTASCT
jgi:hypothetical protein